MDNGIGYRIQLLIEKENISAHSFAHEIGITPGGLNHILSGRNKPRFDVLQKIIEKYQNLNLNWLFSGCPPMYKKKEEKAVLSTDLFKDKSEDVFTEKFYLSNKIDEIRLYFKNKTYLVFKLEK